MYFDNMFISDDSYFNPVQFVAHVVKLISIKYEFIKSVNIYNTVHASKYIHIYVEIISTNDNFFTLRLSLPFNKSNVNAAVRESYDIFETLNDEIRSIVHLVNKHDIISESFKSNYKNRFDNISYLTKFVN